MIVMVMAVLLMINHYDGHDCCDDGGGVGADDGDDDDDHDNDDHGMWTVLVIMMVMVVLLMINHYDGHDCCDDGGGVGADDVDKLNYSTVEPRFTDTYLIRTRRRLRTVCFVPGESRTFSLNSTRLIRIRVNVPSVTVNRIE